MTAIPCQFEHGRGPDPYGGQRWRTSQVVTHAGKLYLLDTAGKVRRYENATPDGCALRLDPSFGENGLLDSGEVGEERIDDMTIDQTGAIYLSGWRTQTLRRLVDGRIEEVCPISMKSIHAAPESALLIMNSDRVDIANGTCESRPVRYSGLPEQPGFAKPFGPDLVAARNKDARFSLSLHSANGKLKAKLAQKGEQGELCHVERVSPCAAGICVLDLNCRSIHGWTVKGAYVGVVKLLPLLGLANPWPKDIAISDAESYLVVHQQGPGNRDYTVLFRILGLR